MYIRVLLPLSTGQNVSPQPDPAASSWSHWSCSRGFSGTVFSGLFYSLSIKTAGSCGLKLQLGTAAVEG